MSDQNLGNLIDILNQEKWTRATLNSYTINNFKELDTFIVKILEDKTEEEAKKACEEHLHHTKNSIIALYVSGIVNLKRQLLDDTNLIKLINIFTDNHKWNIVEYLCLRILDFTENKFALKTLSECYANENKDDEKYKIWERLIKVDSEEAEIVYSIGEKYEKEGQLEQAIDYYKKAIHRFLNKKLYSNLKEIWNKLINLIPNDLDFFFQIDKKIAKILSPERTIQLLEELYKNFVDRKDWDNCISILKRMIDYDPKNHWARKEITQCFKEKYIKHSHIEEYIKLSNLTQSWRNIHDAIADFEKHIAFDRGNFVYHKAWGVGRISEIKDDNVVIDFAKKRAHSMSLKMAVNALLTLKKDHIWVLKSVTKKEELKEKILNDVPWTLKTIIKSFDNISDMKKIKAELVPSVLSNSEWTSFSSEARKVFKNNTEFGNVPEKADLFVIREKPISYDEKSFNKFKAEKDYFSKAEIFIEFIKNSNPSSEFFNEITTFFANYLKSLNNANEYTVSSYLLLKLLKQVHPSNEFPIQVSFKELLNKIENIESLFQKIETDELKIAFLNELKENFDNWNNYFIKLFPYYLSSYIIEELLKAGHSETIKEMATNIFEQYKENREAFIWIIKNKDNFEIFKNLNFSFEKTLLNMIHLLDISFREINNRRDTGLNRKINRQIQNYLFKENTLLNYILNSDEDSANRLFTLIDDIKDLDPSAKIGLKHKIMEKFPNIKFYNAEITEKISKGIITTAICYENKKKELSHILDVEIPKNSKEIGAAIQLGDLRENAEYKAGKEKQELLNLTVSKLKDELEKVQIFDKTKLNTEAVSFGTTVILKNNKENRTEEYTIMGPWESDPSKNIISYLSPFGAVLLNHKKDEELSFNINETDYNYTILEIKDAGIV